MFCVIAVKAPKGWSNQRVSEHIVAEMRKSRPAKMTGLELAEFEYGLSTVEEVKGVHQRVVKGELK